MATEFISESIEPDRGSFDTAAMTTGLAALPGGLTWRGRHYEIVECIEHSKRSSPEGHAAGRELYLRRQHFKVRLDSGVMAELYVERNAPAGSSRRRARRLWYLYTIDDEVRPGG